MVVATEIVARRYEDVSADTPISVDIPAYLASDIYVYYGKASLHATPAVDFTVSLADDFDTFTITPTASLIAKMQALMAGDPSETNSITVRRRLPYTTEATPAGVRYTPFTSREFDRNSMRDMQLRDQGARAVRLSDRFEPPYPSLEIDTMPDVPEDEPVLVFKAGGGVGYGPSSKPLNVPTTLVFPLDLGWVTDVTITNEYDLGSV